MESNGIYKKFRVRFHILNCCPAGSFDPAGRFLSLQKTFEVILLGADYMLAQKLCGFLRVSLNKDFNKPQMLVRAVLRALYGEKILCAHTLKLI